MDHSYIDENQLAERYLQGQLPPAEAAAFEEHSLGCQECLDRLELAEVMQRGLREVAVQEAERTAVEHFGILVSLARLSRSRAAPWLLVSALLIAVLPAGFLAREVGERERDLERARAELARERARPGEEKEEKRPSEELRRLQDELAAARANAANAANTGNTERDLSRERQRVKELTAELGKARQPQINVPVLSLSPTRSAPDEGEPANRVALQPGMAWIVLSLEVDGPVHPAYRATLAGPDRRTLWRGEGLMADGLGAVSLALPSSLLGEGDLLLLLEGVPLRGAPVAAGRFSLRVVRDRG